MHKMQTKLKFDWFFTRTRTWMGTKTTVGRHCTIYHLTTWMAIVLLIDFNIDGINFQFMINSFHLPWICLRILSLGTDSMFTFFSSILLRNNNYLTSGCVFVRVCVYLYFDLCSVDWRQCKLCTGRFAETRRKFICQGQTNVKVAILLLRILCFMSLFDVTNQRNKKFTSE